MNTQNIARGESTSSREMWRGSVYETSAHGLTTDVARADTIKVYLIAIE
jgi:hypothetical protein